MQPMTGSPVLMLITFPDTSTCAHTKAGSSMHAAKHFKMFFISFSL
jgi:hypothetical protein